MERRESAVRISVVMAVYNAAPFLPQCLDSLVAQTFEGWELVCVDDGSTDNGLDILRDYQTRLPDMTVLTQENQGAGMARNLGMDHATGKYLLFLDSDDYFEPDLLEKLWQGAESSGADITICRSQCFDHETGSPLPSEWLRKDQYLDGKTVFSPQDIATYLFQFTYGWAWDKLFLREYVAAHQFRFPELRNSEDLVFVFSALCSCGGIAIVSASLVHYRMKRTNSVSHSRVHVTQAPWRAMELLEDYLQQNNIYSIYEQTFLNWTMEFLVWNVANMPYGEVQKEEFLRVKRKFFPKYQFGCHDQSYYHHRSTYLKFLFVKNSSYVLFSLGLKGYQSMKTALYQK